MLHWRKVPPETAQLPIRTQEHLCVEPITARDSSALHGTRIGPGKEVDVNKMADETQREAPYFARPPAVLFYHKSMKSLAERIAERCSRVSNPSVISKVGIGGIFPRIFHTIELKDSFRFQWMSEFIAGIAED